MIHSPAMEAAKRVERIGDAMLILADCRDWLETVPPCFRVNAVVTDPPYGVEFSGKAGHYRNEPRFKRTDTYASYADSGTRFTETIRPVLEACLARADCGAVFMADKSLPNLPPWKGLGGIYLPNGCGMTSWGFQTFMHCAFYGSDPYLAARKGSMPNGKYGLYGNDANQVDHPCAKPIAAMEWAVSRASLEGHTVLDPFMGSGTTGVACAKLGRKFVGIEIDAGYFDTACRRIEAAYKQPDFFIERPAPAVQQPLFKSEAAE